MAGRYLTLFKFNERMYAKGSPIIIEAGALHKDTIIGDVVAQLKFSSVVSKKILSLTTEITCYNAANDVITSSFIYKYKDIVIDDRQQFFGNKTLITLPDNNARSFKVKITEVGFSDGSTVSLVDEWNRIPMQNEMPFFDNGFLSYFKKKYGTDAKFSPLEFYDLWFCTCGQENKNETCSRCGIKYIDIFPFDIERERKNAVYELAKKKMNGESIFDYESAIELFESIPGFEDVEEKSCVCQKKIEEIKAKAEADRLEKERQAEMARKEAEKRAKRAKRNKKIVIITMLIVCAIIGIIIFWNTVIIPNKKYNDAVALMDAGNVVEAYETLVALDGYKDSANKASSIYNKYKVEKIKASKVGDYVFLGAYEQDNNTSNGKENIEWLVLEVKDGKALVISKYALDCKLYNAGKIDITWETCTLRNWLNSHFINTAFSADEKKMIPTVTVPADKNPEYDTNPGNTTQDQVFLLSITEANKYFSSTSARQCKPTEYAVDNGTNVNSNDGNCWWWLRSLGRDQGYASRILNGGGVGAGGRYVNSEYGAVRPAMWVDLNA